MRKPLDGATHYHVNSSGYHWYKYTSENLTWYAWNPYNEKWDVSSNCVAWHDLVLKPVGEIYATDTQGNLC